MPRNSGGLMGAILLKGRCRAGPGRASVKIILASLTYHALWIIVLFIPPVRETT
jgi:hypothetical protein